MGTLSSVVQTKYSVVKDSLLPSDDERMTQEEQEKKNKRGGMDRYRSRLFLLVSILLAGFIIGSITIFMCRNTNNTSEEDEFFVTNNYTFYSNHSRGEVKGSGEGSALESGGGEHDKRRETEVPKHYGNLYRFEKVRKIGEEVANVLAKVSKRELKRKGKENARRFANRARRMMEGFKSIEFVGIIFELAYGSTIEAHRHKEIMKSFDVVKEKLDNLGDKIEQQMEEWQSLFYGNEIIESLRYFKWAFHRLNDYLQNPKGNEKIPAKEFLQKGHQDGAIGRNMLKIEDNIGKYFEKGSEAKPDYYLWLNVNLEIMARINQALQVFNTACRISHKENSVTDDKARNQCEQEREVIDNTVKKIEAQMDVHIEKCKQKSFAINKISGWIKNNINDDGESFQTSRNSIRNYIEENFPIWKYFVVVYEPVTGYDNHITNAHIQLFRYHERNIAIHLIPEESHKDCSQHGSQYSVTKRKSEEWNNEKLLRSAYQRLSGYRTCIAEEKYRNSIGWSVYGYWCQQRTNHLRMYDVDVDDFGISTYDYDYNSENDRRIFRTTETSLDLKTLCLYFV